jgi:Tfp pilus assembly protein PilF
MYVLSTDADSPQSHFRRRVKYATALFAYCLAMLAKPSAMAAPLICVCLDYFRNVRPRQSIARLIPWFALAIPCMIWTREVQFQPASQPLLVRIGVAMDSLAFYLFKLIAPIHHAADYGRRPKAILDSGAIYFTWLLPAAVIAFAWLIRKRSPVVPASLGVFCAAVAPVSGIVPFDFQHYSTVADHYLYVAMLGAALLAAWGISRTPSKTTTRVAALLLVALGARSWVQTWNWRDSPTFFTHILEVNPNSWFANRNIAAALVDAGHPQEAMEYLRTALAANPEYAKNYITLGVAYMSMRQPDRAIQAWERALQLDPDNAVIHTNIAATLAEQGQFEQARAHLVQALQIDPNDSQAHLNLGTLLAQTNQPEAAIAELRLATRLAPRDPRARTNLGFVLLGRGDASGAIREFSIALSIDPSSRAAAEGMAQAKAKLAP